MFIANIPLSLPFHQVRSTETDHSIASSNTKIPEQTFPESDPA